MPIPYLERGPATYQTASPIVAGKLVILDPENAAHVVQNTTANSNKIVGVSATNAGPRTDQDGENPVDLAQYPPEVGVYYDVDIPVTYSSPASLGEKLVADTLGGVEAYTTVLSGERTDAGCSVTSGSTTVLDSHCVSGDVGKAVSGTGIPGGATIATVVPSTSFVLSAPATGARTDAGCGTTALSAVVTDSHCVAGDVGQAVSGAGIPGGTTVQSVVPGVSITLSAAATATATVAVTIQTTTTESLIIQAVSASTFDSIVGICTEPLGVAEGGTLARAWIGR